MFQQLQGWSTQLQQSTGTCNCVVLSTMPEQAIWGIPVFVCVHEQMQDLEGLSLQAFESNLSTNTPMFPKSHLQLAWNKLN